ncbi:MAG: RNA polymerase sigma factor [Flavisolibacter sp.]
MQLFNSTLSQLDLLKGCIRNDRRCQELLYKQYCHSLLSISRAYIRSEEDAIEVLQDSFLKIFQQIGRYDNDKSTLYTWMRTIVVRTSIDFLRKGKNAPQTMEWQEDHDPIINAEVLDRMEAQEIGDLLNQLTETSRIVFNLFITEGYTHKEIGEILKMSEGTSKWYLSEVRKYLTINLKARERA